MSLLRVSKYAALALTAGLACASGARACNAGPDYCADDPRVPAALAAKKQELKRQGYPDRLIGLLDLGVQCVARIRTEPANFRIIDVAADGSFPEVNWDDDEERIAKANLLSGKSKRYWIVNARRAFSCAGQKPFDQQPDYNPADDVNADGAIKCTAQGQTVKCTR
jgi:hypothetical protein